jgi:hypothetical protein
MPEANYLHQQGTVVFGGGFKARARALCIRIIANLGSPNSSNLLKDQAMLAKYLLELVNWLVLIFPVGGYHAVGPAEYGSPV